VIEAAALVLVVVAFPLCLLRISVGEPVSRLAGLEVLGAAATVALLLIARIADRTPYVDVALVTALLSFAGSLAFARFLGRTL
jgi:multicomponent Na+:H+ antiporter subunit F